jgi:hypothetical protein
LTTKRGTVRYEDVERFLSGRRLDQNVRTGVLNWVAQNKVVSGKKFSQQTSLFEDVLFNYLLQAYVNHQPTTLSSRKSIGRPEGVGHSANEPKVKGLVANHEYAVTAVWAGPPKTVTIWNPWREYGRKHVTDGTHQHRSVADPGAASSTLSIQEIVKRFRGMQISAQSLA